MHFFFKKFRNFSEPTRNFWLGLVKQPLAVVTWCSHSAGSKLWDFIISDLTLHPLRLLVPSGSAADVSVSRDFLSLDRVNLK